jgi:hypothetical protein
MTNINNPILMVREFIFPSFGNKLGLTVSLINEQLNARLPAVIFLCQLFTSEPQAQQAKVSAADVSPIKHDTQGHRFSPSGHEVVAPLAIFSGVRRFV